MKRALSISALLLAAAISPAWGQLLSSHAAAPASPKPAAVTVPSPTGKPVARVNGAVLTYGDLLREEYTIFPYARQHNGMIPPALESDIRTGAMKMIVFEELVYQEAQRRKITIPPARLERAEADFRKQFASQQEYQDLLKSEFKGSKTVLQTKIERSLLIDEMLKTEVSNRSYVTQAEVRAYYDKNPQQFRIPESFAVQTISVIPPENANPDQQKAARKKAEDALRQAQATKSYDDFGVLAEKISEDDFRVMMGDHRAVDQTKLPPQVLQVIKGMQPGQISGLIELENHAYTIVRLNAHIEAGEQKFEAVKDALREQLKKQKAEQLRRALDARLRKNAKVEEL
jgi:peptidyl-prolyl cis-trans isomerase C